MMKSYRIAMVCALAPLFVGTSVFLLWVITRWPSLMRLGVFTIYGGLALVAFGFVSLAGFYRSVSCATELPRRRVRTMTSCCAALLLSNFAVAAGILVAVFYMDTCYTVVVENTSFLPLNHVRVEGGGIKMNFGTIPPGGTASRSAWIQHDGSLKLHATNSTATHAMTIEGYVTHGLGGHTTVTINQGQQVSIKKR